MPSLAKFAFAALAVAALAAGAPDARSETYKVTFSAAHGTQLP